MTYHDQDTLPDLRVTIAESMEALADAQMQRARGADAADFHGEGTRWNRAMRGAQTLRWCAEREAPSYEEMKADLDAAQLAQEEAELLTGELVDNLRFAVSKWTHAVICPVGKEGTPDWAPCICALDERRTSVLDAVA